MLSQLPNSTYRYIVNVLKTIFDPVQTMTAGEFQGILVTKTS